MIRWMIGVFAFGVTQVALAQLLPPKTGGAVPAGLMQKQVFARSLIEDASVEKRVMASQDAEAQRLLASSKLSFSDAMVSLESGDFASADRMLGEAMSAIGKARRRVPDVAGITARQRADYERLLPDVESLYKSYLGYQQRGKLTSGASGEIEARTGLDLARLFESARTHAEERRYGDALKSLENAEQVMKSGIGRVIGAATLDYAQKFESQSDEFAYEVERNKSFLELIPVAIAELKPGVESEEVIGDLVEQNRMAIEQASKYARAKDYDEALSSIRVGIGYLRNALTVVGVLLPQPSSE